ncbi:phosphohydrolase [Virgibacillus profundi]|uniref:bis(5'-nucleosyl)-tetraphosphatase (symmetrical) n=1 Tax=Virgibacillus profundi TaxID=2024555 RepID=A0A2A2ICJ7_9BACI|nr:bis(5'-nucleosyl)-tetraphosphatase (symmetrical) YqeK [Virgibacillus profundi]PAV28994.1 phosphohydrolase [Virgibacillus profundi]PXY53162.1 HD domain-containing protein [Virgibacillus profundi]
MKINEAIEHVKPHLTKERFEHTLRVQETAANLAKLYNESKEKTELAAIFHDYAKYRPLDEMERWIVESRLPKDLLHYHHELWHGPVAAILIEKEYGIKDNDIQCAIAYHTTGRAHMGKLEQIIFLADYIEPGRSFPGVEEVREMAKKDLIHACLMASRNTIQFLMHKNATIYPDTFHAYNDLTRMNRQ